MPILHAIVASLLVVVPFTPGVAASNPPEVSEWFDHEALPIIFENEEGAESLDDTGPDYSTATDISQPIEVWMWSSDFIGGKPTQEPATRTGEWIAVILAGEKPLGVVSAEWDSDAHTVSFASYSDDALLGRDLLSAKSDSRVVNDEPSSTWVALTDDGVTAIDDDARVELPKPTTVEDYQKVVAARYAQSIEDSEAVGDGAAGGGGPTSPISAPVSWLTFGGVLVLIAGLSILTTLLVRRRRAIGS